MDVSKLRTLAPLDDVSRDLVEILSESTDLNKDEQSYIESHLRLMQVSLFKLEAGPY
jgi:hypothetical protein